MIAKSFNEWFASNENPLSKATETAQFFAADALKAAFKAGMMFERELTKPGKNIKPVEIEDIFR